MATPYKDLFVAGDFIISPKVYNEFSPGNVGTNNQGFSFGIHGAWEFNLANLPWMIEGDFRQFNYPHNQGVNTPATWTPGATCLSLGVAAGDQGCVTAIGGRSHVRTGVHGARLRLRWAFRHQSSQPAHLRRRRLPVAFQ